MALIDIKFNPEDFAVKPEMFINEKTYTDLPIAIKETKYKDLITKIDHGVYINDSYIPLVFQNFKVIAYPLEDPEVEVFEGQPWKMIYGICDNHQQIFERDSRIKQIIESNSDYIIMLTYIDKIKNPLWRWHKNGTYIGDHKISQEFIGNEPDSLKGVYIYKIYKVIKNKK